MPAERRRRPLRDAGPGHAEPGPVRRAWRALREYPLALIRGAALARGADDPEPMRLACTYALLRSKRLLYAARPSLAPRRERLLGWDVAYATYPMLVYLVEDVLLSAPYRVSLSTDAPVIVDCGANIGLSALYFRRRFPRSRIVAFEPDPPAFALLRENLDRNGCADVVAHAVALGCADGTVEFFYDDAMRGSVHAGTVGRPWLTGRSEVPVRRLSTLLPDSVDLLKLDVEGAEGDVLDDLVQTGALDRVAAVVMEYHHHLDDQDKLGGVLSLLERAGFGYQLATAENHAILGAGSFQDVLLYAYRRRPGEARP